MRKVALSDPSYPSILFFYQGTVSGGERFFGRYWPEARAVADLPRRFYNAFGIERGGMWAMFVPKVWAAGLRAALKGNFSSLSGGDLWTMPGLFLAKGGTILWKHPFHHIGDHPDFNRIVERVLPSR